MRTAVITGGVSGLGAASAVRLREDGVRKVLAGLTSADEVISITLGDAN